MRDEQAQNKIKDIYENNEKLKKKNFFTYLRQLDAFKEIEQNKENHLMNLKNKLNSYEA